MSEQGWTVCLSTSPTVPRRLRHNTHVRNRHVHNRLYRFVCDGLFLPVLVRENLPVSTMRVPYLNGGGSAIHNTVRGLFARHMLTTTKAACLTFATTVHDRTPHEKGFSETHPLPLAILPLVFLIALIPSVSACKLHLLCRPASALDRFSEFIWEYCTRHMLLCLYLFYAGPLLRNLHDQLGVREHVRVAQALRQLVERPVYPRQLLQHEVIQGLRRRSVAPANIEQRDVNHKQTGGE